MSNPFDKQVYKLMSDMAREATELEKKRIIGVIELIPTRLADGNLMYADSFRVEAIKAIEGRGYVPGKKD